MAEPKSTRVRATEELKREFSSRLMSRLASMDMNQSDLSRAIGVSKDAVSTYARARSIPSDETLAKMAKLFGCDTSELLPARYDTATLSSPFQITMLADGTVNIEVSTNTTFETASKIMELLRREAVHTE